MIDRDRLIQTFTTLVEMDSLSRREGNVAALLIQWLTDMGAEVVRDGAGARIGGDADNLVARFPGNRPAPPILLNAHMDTVEPGTGIKATLRDGVFRSAGDTILGADDKSAIAILLEVLRTVRENDLPHPPVELLLTVAEEVGLLGAKNLDYGLITARGGYALDTGDITGIVTRAPGANHFEITIHGREAHAGVAPEKGVNAIIAASRAIARLDCIGRIDAETTCNIGVIQGGLATNIVPNHVVIKGEARSHNPEKLAAVTRRIVDTFPAVAEELRTASGDPLPTVDVKVSEEFARTHIPDDHPVVILAQEAAAARGMALVPKTTGGGADANVFFQKGLVVGVLGTGMTDMHTVNEHIALEDMVSMAGLVIEILCRWSGDPGPADPSRLDKSGPGL